MTGLILQPWIKCGGVLLALGLIACETQRVQTGRGGRRGGSGTNTSTTGTPAAPGNGNNNNQTPGTSGNMQDILEYCAKKSACDDQRDLNLSRCANQGTYIVAYAREFGDPAQMLDCIERVKSASCGELPDCGWPQPGHEHEHEGEPGNPDSFFEGGDGDEERFSGEGRCEGTVAVHGEPENEVRYDCANQPSGYDRTGTNKNCVLNDRGQARCGVSTCEEAACLGEIRTRCKNGVLQGMYDCANDPHQKTGQCFLNSLDKPTCGYDTCGGGDEPGENRNDICIGSVRASCYLGIASYREDCAYEGFACLMGQGEENSSVTGCGREFTGCTQSECRGDKVVACDRGAEAVIDCQFMDSSYSTCQLIQENRRDTPMCYVPSSQRDCSGISATCEGNVAKVCVGGKLQSVDCSSVLPGGVCVLQTGNSEIDVRCRSTD